MATSSFTKTFVFSADVTKIIQSIQEQSGVRASSISPDRIEEGKEALAQFSSFSKNNTY